MVKQMPDRPTQVSLPFRSLPTTDGVRTALSNVIRDIQRDHDLTDIELAGAIGVHPNTIQRARNKQGTLDNEAMARLGAVFGPEAMRPYTVMWERGADDAPELLPLLADAMAAVSRAKGPKGKLDALPVVKELIAAADAFVTGTEQMRLRAVS